MLSEAQQEALDAYNLHNFSENFAAKHLNISRSTLRNRLYAAARQGYSLAPDTNPENAPIGFSLDKTTIHLRDGNVVQRWDRVSPTHDQYLEYFLDRIPASTQIPPPSDNNDLMLEWCIFDMHIGLHSWAKETGADYDSKLARQLMVSAAKKIFQHTGRVEQAVLIGGGDNYHADNRSNQTEKSHHTLDTDSRFQKTAWIVYETWCSAIDLAAANAQQVKVVILSGNHDHHSSMHLAMILSAHYRNEPRITVDISPAKHKYYRWGSNFFMTSHGDTGAKRLASYLMNHIIKSNIQGIERMFVRAGHLHKRGRQTPPGLVEEDGVIIEIFPTLAPADAWAAEEAYSNVRATVCNLWHKEFGQRSRIELGVKELLSES